MARLVPVCDVPNCGGSRRRHQRLCERCYRKLPGDIRVGLTEAHHQRRLTDWRKLRRRAADFLNLPDPAAATATGRYVHHHVTPQRAFELQARLLGERP